MQVENFSFHVLGGKWLAQIFIIIVLSFIALFLFHPTLDSPSLSLSLFLSLSLSLQSYSYEGSISFTVLHTTFQYTPFFYYRTLW